MSCNCLRCKHLLFHSDIVEIEEVDGVHVLVHKIQLWECPRCGITVKIVQPALQFTKKGE